MDLHNALPQYIPNENHMIKDDLMKSEEYDNIDVGIEKVFTFQCQNTSDKEVDILSENFNNEDEKIFLIPEFKEENLCSDVPQITINISQQDSMTTNPFTPELPSQNKTDPVFRVQKPKNKGRKKKEDTSIIIYETNNTQTENVHSKFKKDNRIKTIRFHFILFFIDLLNDCIIKENKNKQNIIIKNICKEVTSNLSIKYNNELLETKILDILSNNPIRDTYKTENKFFNKNNVEKIIELKEIFPLTNELLNFTFKDFYSKFVYTEKQHLIDKYGLKKAKNFNDFLNDLRIKKNKNEYLEKLEEAAKDFLSFFEPSRARKKRNKFKK